MTLVRFAPWLLVALAASTIALWVAADASSSAAADTSVETKAFDQLAAIAGAHGHAIPDGLASYAHVGDSVIAHAPLDGIASYRAADFAAGVLIMAVVIADPRPGRVPSGTYAVRVQLDPATGDGTAIFFDAQGSAITQLPAHARTPAQLEAALPGAYDPASATSVPRTHVWRDRFLIDCAGWQPYSVIYF